jgi:hypothetical protein
MQRMKITQNPATGGLDTVIETAEPPVTPVQTLAVAQTATNPVGDRIRSPDLAMPNQGNEQKLALSGRARDVADAEQTLKNHSLNGSFLAHFDLQLKQGKIRIGVIDDFSTSHARNVEQRILDQMPQGLRGKVEIVRYDVAGKDAEGRAQVIAKAAHDAQDKKLLALSVSGGISAYPVANIEKLIGGQDLTKDTARRGYDAVIRNNNTSPTLQNALSELNRASGKIPVVTPVWNDNNTTLPALLLGSNSGNGIITSIDRPAIDPGGKLYHATQIPDLVDVTVPGSFGNPNTSQSTPYFIGNLLRYGQEHANQKKSA